jgi:hypothetical protein
MTNKEEREMKIAINRCWGGFSLSEEAVKLGRELSKDDTWADAVLEGEMYSDGSGPAELYGDSVHIDYNFPRDDKVLIQVVLHIPSQYSCYTLARLPPIPLTYLLCCIPKELFLIFNIEPFGQFSN